MTANINPKTGIAYGYISSRALDSDVVDELMYGSQARNLSYEDAWNDYIAKERREFEDREDRDPEEVFDPEDLRDEFNDLRYQGEEEIIEGRIEVPGYGTVEYCTSWLGGALNFYIFESPFITNKAHQCSLCVPNAGNLDRLDGDYECYDVPADWRFCDD